MAPAPLAQAQLFPLRAWLHVPPPPNASSADACGEVEAEDGFRYVVKRDGGNWLVRASEWLCSGLSQKIGIVAPPHANIEMLNGEFVFGSQYISGVATRVETTAYLLQPTLVVPALPVAAGPAAAVAAPVAAGLGAPPQPPAPPAAPAAIVAAPTLSSLLSSIYAFDLAIGNEDRHLGNFLSIEIAGTKRLFAFDYSRALFLTWPLVGFPLAWTKFAVGPSNTLEWGRHLRAAHGFDLPSALRTVERLEKLDVAVVQSLITEMPTNWLPDPPRSDFLQWWTDGRRSKRLDDLRKGLSDGSLL